MKRNKRKWRERERDKLTNERERDKTCMGKSRNRIHGAEINMRRGYEMMEKKMKKTTGSGER